MKKLLFVPVFLLLAPFAFGQVTIPPCSPVSGTPCTDYFGVPNWAFSPLPTGSIATINVVNGGTGYTNPTVDIMDPTGSGATASVLVTSGVITAISIGSGGSGYSAPQVVITDPNPNAGGATFSVLLGSITGGIRKFQDALPNLPLAVADTTTFPGSDYYVIALQDYTQKAHADLPPTHLRGYVQLNSGTDPSTGQNTVTPPAQSYLGPVILAQRDRPVRVLFKNMLPAGQGGNLVIPVDTTYMGAGAPYTQNRATLHLHGGATPWISDGTPHQWTTPAAENNGPQRGDSVEFVPDMWFDSTGALIAACAGQATCTVAGATIDPGAGALTFYWTNQQGGRLMFYHDHAYGITRLNVYAGEAAGYLLLDPQEEAALAAASVPGTVAGTTPDLAHLVPLVIQDKTFVPNAAQLAAQDPTWIWGSSATPSQNGNGDLWFPHVYVPNQNPADPGGGNAFGRWDYGPWFWPFQTSLTAGPVTVPCTSAAFPNEVVNCPITPNPSGTPEGFMDTPVVNGKAYPVLHVAPEAYRFKILSAGNDRSWNLQLYQAYNPATNTLGDSTGTEVKMLPAVPPANGTSLPLCSTVTSVTQPGMGLGLVTGDLNLGPTGLPQGCWPNYGISNAAGIPSKQFMWPADGRDGGVPDPTTAGPAIIQIGSEGGLLPAPVVIPSTPIGYEYNTRSITVTNVSTHGLWLGPAERADIVVDFSSFAGKTLILYNDAPAPAPAFDSRNDLYTGDADQTAIGGPPTTQPGYGPNTRTVMQIVVDQPATGQGFNFAKLGAALAGVFAQTQPIPIVPEPTYPPASGGNAATATYSNIADNALTFYPAGSTKATTITDGNKTIQELFTPDYGRMNATLGTELPLTNFLNQTTIPLGYVDPVTEIVKQGDTQLWKITHNGVDTHFIHFHLFNVQVVNRMGWDGSVRPPDENELGWKDTVRMNPLEDILVALQPITPTLPWPIANSVRKYDVTDMAPFTNINPTDNTPVTTVNKTTNFGWEYVWHCHILGHEENDMMRPILFQVPPPAPSNLVTAMDAATPGQVDLSWTDNSASETEFLIQRSSDPTFSTGTTEIVVGASTPQNLAGEGTTWGGTMLAIDSPGAGTFYYRVQAVDDGFTTKTMESYNVTPALVSTWSNTASIGGGPIAGVSPTALLFGNVALGTTPSPSMSVTVSNTGTAPFDVTGVVVSGANAADFAVTDSCATLAAPIAPGTSTCTMAVTFTPSVAGPEVATMAVSTTDAGHPALLVTLSGTGGSLPLLTITASNATMKYGGAVPPITPSYSPVNPTGVTPPTCTTIATITSPVGNYASLCAGASSAAYQITYLPGIVAVAPVPLTIWGPNVSMKAGDPVPPLSPAYTGFVAGDSANSLGLPGNTAPTCTTTATSGSAMGTYPVTCSGANDPNYTIKYVAGTVTVTFGSLTITAPNQQMTYGGPLPVFTPTYSVNPPALPFVAPSCATTATTSSPVGSYPITCQRAIDPNYAITYVQGTLQINPAPLTITAPNPTIRYGSPVTTFTPTYTGFVNGETSAVLTPPPACSTTATSTSPAGTYSFTCANASDANYSISYVGGTLTIAQAPLTITASSGSMTYGGSAPTITASFSGFVNGETSSVLTPPPTCSTTATGASPVGSYPSACSGAADPNYAISYVAGTVTVAKASTTTSLTSAPSPSTVGQAVTASFAVAPQFSGTPSGTVTVRASSGQTCSAALAGGSGSCQLLLLPTGNLTLTATYTGDGNFQSSSAQRTQVVTSLTLSTTSLVFGNQLVGTRSASQTITVTNVGATPVTISSVRLSGANAGDFTTNSCPPSLAAGQRCNVNVTFAPTAVGVRNAAVVITDSDVASPQTIVLTGTGVQPIASLTPTPYNFGNVARGTTTAPAIFTLSNTGTAPLAITGITIGGSNRFTISSTTCGTTLAIGSSCTINVTFSPNSRSTFAGTISVTDNAPGSPQTAALSGTGI